VRLAALTRPVASAALLLVSCAEKKQAKEAAAQGGDPPVATVNSESISRRAFERELAREADFAGVAAATSVVKTDELKRSVLDGMVERIVLLVAARQANIAATSEEVEREMLRLRSDYTPERFNEALSQGGLSLAELKEKTAALLTIQKLFQEKVYARVGVTEDEIRSYYEQHASDFEEPEQVRAAQIVVRSAQEARDIQRQLRAGKDFAQLARKFSLSPDAKTGGDLGFFPRGQMPRQFDEVAFRLKLNQISDVVSTQYGFHIFKLLAKRAPRKRTLTEVHAQVERKVQGVKREQAQAEYVKMLRTKAVVNLNPSVLATAGVGATSPPQAR
jgi:peptidyl-prolyl cis-trans isomerase C/foldase protein PrsA